MDAKLTDRKLNILLAIIDSYIDSAQPVGSRSLSKNYNIGFSPATIRNEMSDLDELGYLTQSHISSGRIPSMKAFRLYVDSILSSIYSDRESMTTSLIPSYKRYERIIEPQKLIKSSSEFISEIIEYPVISTLKKSDYMKLSHIELIIISKYNYVLLTLYDSGDLNHTVITSDREISVNELKKINFWLKNLFIGKRLSEVSYNLEKQTYSNEYNYIFKNAILDIIKNEKDKLSSMYISVDGISNIFKYPEYNNIDEAQNIIKYLENKEEIAKLLASSDDFLDIKLGEENKVEALKNSAVIKSSYVFNRNNIGVIAIIAPLRMNYQLSIEAMLKLSWRIKNLINRGDYYDGY